MRLPRVMLLLLVAGLVAPVSGTAGTAGAAGAAPAVPLLVAVRAAVHPGFDRVVFEFRGGLPGDRSVQYVPELLGDASGLPVPVAGRAVLQVRFSPAQAHDDAGQATVPERTAFALRNVVEVVRAGDFEAVTTFGVGLLRQRPYHVFTLSGPPRLVVDIDTRFRTVPRQVFFLDVNRFAAGTEPYFVPVQREVLPSVPATTALHRLYAGPTPAEQRAGLRLVPSGSTGFTRLSIVDGVARLRLAGGCSSGGSTVTVAGSIVPTLKQFSTVSHVKIEDPAGRTQSPTGRSDSVPECLEP